MTNALLLSLFLVPIGCASYTHEVELRVDDPHQAWVEAPEATAAAAQSRPAHRSSRRRGPPRIVRDEDGAISVNGAEVLGSNGRLTPPSSLDDTQRDGDVLKTPICTHTTAGGDCRERVWLATPMSNVISMQERDVPRKGLGWIEVLGGLGLGAAGVVANRLDPYASGGSVLMAVGAIAAVVGLVELGRGPQNERVVVDDAAP
jgi:hypothetical protein